MVYHEIIDFLYNLPREKSKMNRMSGLLEKLGAPHKKLKYVHVAGTNGKGSTCTMLSYVLAEAGYKVGMNISPHVIDFRERIQINNQMISKSDVESLVYKIMPHYKDMKAAGDSPNFFEFVFAMATMYFVAQHCDIVVLEVGLGGRMDSTNVIENPLVAAITSIGIDHTEQLGETIELIAREKAGIIKPNGVTVSYPKQNPTALAVIMETVSRLQNQLRIPHNYELVSMDIFGSSIVYRGQQYRIPLMGEHQIYNALTVLEICYALVEKGYSISVDNMKNGIDKTIFPSRLEKISEHPLILLDGAHNPSGAEALAKSIKLVGNKRIYGLVAVLKEKDVDSIVKILSPVFDEVVATWVPDNPRFIPPKDLGDMIFRFNTNVSYADDPMVGFKQLLDKAKPNDVILVCGSLYLVSHIREEALRLAGGWES